MHLRQGNQPRTRLKKVAPRALLECSANEFRFGEHGAQRAHCGEKIKDFACCRDDANTKPPVVNVAVSSMLCRRTTKLLAAIAESVLAHEVRIESYRKVKRI
jgi:hypothetical protein